MCNSVLVVNLTLNLRYKSAAQNLLISSGIIIIDDLIVGWA